MQRPVRRRSLAVVRSAQSVPNRALRRMSVDAAVLSSGEVGNSTDRKSSLTGEDSDLELFQQLQEQAFLPHKEDVAEWLNKTLSIDITVDNFMDVLDSGVALCRLAKLIQSKAAELPKKDAKEKDRFVSSKRVICRDNAQSGTWFARDNTANFLTWCRACGLSDDCLFETEGLVSQKDERNVILCLLELARLGSKYGIEPPNLIKLENEIDQQGRETPPKNGLSQGKGSGSKGQPPPKRKDSAKPDELHKQVQTISGKCKCENCFQIKRISEGRYNIGGRNVFVRLLKGKHVMVRVGGGWDTLKHYLATHDPCKIMEFRRSGNQVDQSKGSRPAAVANGNDDKFLYIRSKYKS